MTDTHPDQPTPAAQPAESTADTGAARNPGFRMAPPPRPIDDSFADGAAGFIIGRNVLKLDLYRVVGYDRESGQEVRAQSHRIVLPMTAIGELKQLLQQFDEAQQRARGQ
jgi:hypothetical protein